LPGEAASEHVMRVRSGEFGESFLLTCWMRYLARGAPTMLLDDYCFEVFIIILSFDLKEVSSFSFWSWTARSLATFFWPPRPHAATLTCSFPGLSSSPSSGLAFDCGVPATF
jgi:hypothetical protein